MTRLKYIVCLLLLFSLGCNDFLEREPLSEMSNETFFSNKTDMKTWTAGMYDAFQEALSLNHLDWGDLRSDIYHEYGGYLSAGTQPYYMNSLISSLSTSSWEDIYTTIDRANVGIEKFPGIPDLLQSEWGDYVGQCYAMRALMYFYCIRVWGRVPLITKSWEGDTETMHVSRSEIIAVKEVIMSDIENAIYYLNSGVTGDRKFYFNLGAVHAMKMDVHMWFNEYREALNTWDAYFAGSSDYRLVSTAASWKDMFTNPTSSTETIFSMYWSYEEDGNQTWGSRVGASDNNNPFMISQALYEEWVARLRSGNGADGRFWNTLDTVAIYIAGSNMPISTIHWSASTNTRAAASKCIKYSEASSSASRMWTLITNATAELYAVMYRYADVVLLRAEALNQLGYPAEALAIVNQIRSRVGYIADAVAEVNTTDKDAVRDLILLERQLEFYAEGRRWFDLCRNGILIDVMDPVYSQRQLDDGVTVTGFGHEGRIVWPIYYREFEANTALQGDQNLPYTE